MPFDPVISSYLSQDFKYWCFPIRNGKEAFDLQVAQGWTLAVSGAQYKAFSQQMRADVNQHEFVIHMLGTCLGCQSDFQGSQAPYYDLCGELFLFLSPHQCFLLITKNRVWWSPACILLRDEKKIFGRAKKTQDFYGTEFYNRSGWAWIFPVLVCATKLFYWNKYVPTNSQMEHKAICQQLI